MARFELAYSSFQGKRDRPDSSTSSRGWIVFLSRTRQPQNYYYFNCTGKRVRFPATDFGDRCATNYTIPVFSALRGNYDIPTPRLTGACSTSELPENLINLFLFPWVVLTHLPRVKSSLLHLKASRE